MSDMSMESIEGARAHVAAQVAAAEARKMAVDQLVDDVRDTTATAKSARGEVTVVAAPTGRVVSLLLTESSTELRAPELAKLITDTIASAQHAAAMLAVTLASNALDPSSPLVVQLRAEATAAFPGPDTPTLQ